MFLKSLLTTGTLTAATAVAGSVASKDVKSAWYRRLKKPAIQPPPAVFPIVWTALYADIALVSASVLSRRQATTDACGRAARRGRGYLGALLVNLALNAGWSWSFFRWHRLRLAVGVAAALAVSCAGLARRAGAVKPVLGWALAPYAAWCGFATLLSERIRRLNR